MRSLRSVSRALFVGLVVILSIGAAIPAAAQERNIQVGGLVGPNFSQLNGPTDPEGEVTVLGGTAFTGTGFTAGLTAAYPLLEVPYGALFAELDALYSRHVGTGFAESRTTNVRSELTLTADTLRLPLFARYDIADDPLSIRFGLGPELLLGFGTSHETQVVGIDPPDEDNFATTTTTHVGLATKLGVSFEVGAFRVPLDLRFTWDPMVPSSTRERLENYQSFDEPGQYQVAYDLQFLAVIGVEFDLSGDMSAAMSAARSAAARFGTQEKNERSEPPGEGPPSPVASESSGKKKKRKKQKKQKSADTADTESTSDASTTGEDDGTAVTTTSDADTDTTNSAESSARELRDTLWVDCREDEKHDRCARPSWLEPGAFGDGPSIETLPGFGTELTDGFVDYQTGELIVGAKWKANEVSGYVVAIDLESGDRTLISGRHKNKESGTLMSVGSGPTLGYVYDVELGPDDQLYAYHAVSDERFPRISRVNRKDGSRELIWVAEDDKYGQCMTSGGREIIPTFRNFAIGSEGEFYVGVSNSKPSGSGWGVIRISPDGSECGFVSISESEHGNDVGKGDNNQTGEIYRLEMIGGTLWATHWQTQSLWAFNVGDGTRKRVSSSSNTVGTGDGDATVGTSGLAWIPSRGLFLTAGRAGRDTAVTWIEPVSGERESVEIGLGPMEVGVFDSSPVWVHPSGKFVLFVVEGQAIVMLDPETGVSNIISM